jgi:hypothetical protein
MIEANRVIFPTESQSTIVNRIWRLWLRLEPAADVERQVVFGVD